MPKIKINITYYFPIKVKKSLSNHILTPRDTNEIFCVKWIKIEELKKSITNRETKIFLTRKLHEAKKIVCLND